VVAAASVVVAAGSDGGARPLVGGKS
jgi:hypothetical protein